MKKTLLIVMAAMAFVTCKKQTVAGPEGPQGPQGPQGAQGPAGTTANGSLFGKITLIDPNATTSTVSLANTTVSIADQTVSAVTDSKGSYTISNVAPGMLDILVSANDGTMYKWQQYAYPGNNKALLNVSLSKKITEPVSGRINDTIVGGKKGLYVRSIFTPSLTGSRGLALIIGNSNQISPYDANSYLYSTMYLGSGSNLKISFFLDYDDIKSPYTFSAGQQIYVTAFPVPASNFSYWDAYAGAEVFYAAGNPIAQITTITLP